MKNFVFLFLSCIVSIHINAQTTVTLTSGTLWQVPNCVTSISVECWGAGGGGGYASSNGQTTGGGGGGAYAQTTMTVSAGSSIPYSIGAGGSGASGISNGGDTWFSTSATVLAKGGSGASDNSTTGAAGGQASASIGTITFSGGNGGSGSGSGNCAASGGGGGGAGSASAGNSGGNGTDGSGLCLNGGTGGAGGSANGSGGAGGKGANSGGAGTSATTTSGFGGGGGGAKSAGVTGGSYNGGNGAAGGIKITYTPSPPSAAISYAGSPWCPSATAQTPTVTGTTGGTFSASPSGLSIDANTGVITPSTSTIGTYTVTYSLNNSCGTATTTASVAISSSPSATISYAGSPWCTNATAQTPTITGTTGGTFSASPNGLSINATTGVITPSTSTVGSYTVTYNFSNSCGSGTATANVVVSPAPSATISYAGLPWCANTSAQTPTITGTTGGTFSASPNGLNINATTGAITPSTSTAGSYTVTYSFAGSCGSGTATANVSIADSPQIAVEPTNFCSGNSGGLACVYSGTQSLTYSWSTGETTSSIAMSHPGSACLTVTDNNGCTATDCGTVVEYPLPVAVISSNTGGFCDTAATTLVGSGGTSFLWSNDSTTNTIMVEGNGTYSLTVTDANNCSGSVSINVQAAPLLGEISMPDSASICERTEPLVLYAYTSNADTYLWSNGTSEATDTVSESGIYSVTVSNACQTKTKSCRVEFVSCDHFRLPSAFTPNGDGKNDTYHWAKDSNIAVSAFTMRIYNRWGQKMFETNDPSAGWDGKFNGEAQPIDSYSVFVEISYPIEKGQTRTDAKQSSFTLLR